MNKYRNRVYYVKGERLDSKREGKAYLDLLWRLERGEITDLQPHYKMNGKTIRAITYIADFTYYDAEGKYHVIDVKGFRTEVYKIKKKLFEFKYNIEIEEI